MTRTVSFALLVVLIPHSVIADSRLGQRELALTATKSAFFKHWKHTGEIAKKWDDLEPHVRLPALENTLGQPLRDAYVLLETPTKLSHSDTRMAVLVERAGSPNPRTGAFERYAIVLSDDALRFASTVVHAHHVDELVEQAIAPGGENKPLAINRAREHPSQPVASVPPEDRAGRYLKFLLWLACLAIMTVVGVTLWRSVRRDTEREHEHPTNRR